MQLATTGLWVADLNVLLRGRIYNLVTDFDRDELTDRNHATDRALWPGRYCCPRQNAAQRDSTQRMPHTKVCLKACCSCGMLKPSFAAEKSGISAWHPP